MASKSIKMKAKASNGETTVKALIKHPMETGHYIKEVTCSYQGEQVLTTEWGPTISKNPFISFTFMGGAAGEKVELTWTDNKGGSETSSATIK